MTLKIVFTTTSLVFLFGITVVKDYSLVLERLARLGGSWWGQPCTKAVFIGFSLWSVVKGQQLENGFIFFFCLVAVVMNNLSCMSGIHGNQSFAQSQEMSESICCLLKSPDVFFILAGYGLTWMQGIRNAWWPKCKYFPF